jgi:hypothetical protein
MIFKIFSQFFTQNKANLKKLITTLVFEKNANFFAENWQKSQKIVIITSTAGHFVNFTAIWYILFPFEIFSPDWVCCTQKNLARLLVLNYLLVQVRLA